MAFLYDLFSNFKHVEHDVFFTLDILIGFIIDTQVEWVLISSLDWLLSLYDIVISLLNLHVYIKLIDELYWIGHNFWSTHIQFCSNIVKLKCNQIYYDLQCY